MNKFKSVPLMALLLLAFSFSFPSHAAGPNITICSVDSDAARVPEFSNWGTGTLNGAEAVNLRAKLLNPDNFSPTGIEPITFTIVDAFGPSGSITAASLAANGCEIFFKGYVYDSGITAAEITAMYTWVNTTGGTLMSFDDNSAVNAFAESASFGHPTVNSGSTPWDATAAGLVHPIFNGPFGTANGLLTNLQQAYYSNTSGATVLATESSNSNATVLDRPTGNGYALFVADVDTVGSQVSNGNGNNTDQDHVALNMFAHAAAQYNENNYTPSDPVITAPSDGATTTDNTPTVSGTAEPGVTITVTGPNGESCTTTADFNTGAWSCNISPALNEGNNTLTAIATYGSNSSGNDSIVLNVDTTAPAAPVINVPTNGAPVTGTGEPGATVTVTTGGSGTCTAVVQLDGTWSCTLSGPVVDGDDIMAT
ncbi:Ig-like domain-containing protein, partial [Marinicella litoralis]